jgi:hypothetical protein
MTGEFLPLSLLNIMWTFYHGNRNSRTDAG